MIDRFGRPTPAVFSINAPVPGNVRALATDLRSSLLPAERIRDDLTLVVKRLPADTWEEFATVERTARQLLADQSPVAVRLDGVGRFGDPPAGPGPVLYLRIESPGLEALHRRLVDRFGAAGDIEGEAYVPHITLARGTGADTARERVEDAGIPPIDWEVDQLLFRDGRRDLDVGTIALERR